MINYLIRVRDRPIFCTDLQIRTTFRFWWVGGFPEGGCSDFGPGNNPYTVKCYDYSEVYIFLRVINVRI